jgi:hypothetical protein
MRVYEYSSSLFVPVFYSNELRDFPQFTRALLGRSRRMSVPYTRGCVILSCPMTCRRCVWRRCSIHCMRKIEMRSLVVSLPDTMQVVRHVLLIINRPHLLSWMSIEPRHRWPSLDSPLVGYFLLACPQFVSQEPREKFLSSYNAYCECISHEK